MGLLALRDAVASVALSHHETCGCLVCRASAGDAGAFAEILLDAMDGDQ